MTEQHDTADLRALITKNGPPLSPMLIFTLLDALDAARTERDEWKENTLANEALYLKHFTRAEAAEARTEAALDIAYVDVLLAKISELTVRARAAEAMRDTHAADVTDLANKYARALDRAEAAEAERDDLRREGDWKANQAWARCSHAHKAAEARIAAALLVCCNYEWCGDGMECEVRRALTEGTGQ